MQHNAGVSGLRSQPAGTSRASDAHRTPGAGAPASELAGAGPRLCRGLVAGSSEGAPAPRRVRCSRGRKRPSKTGGPTTVQRACDEVFPNARSTGPDEPRRATSNRDRAGTVDRGGLSGSRSTLISRLATVVAMTVDVRYRTRHMRLRVVHGRYRLCVTVRWMWCGVRARLRVANG